MATYLVTGVSRGIGFEFLRQLSSDSANTVIGLVRNKEATEKKIAAELGELKNVHIIHADLLDYKSLKASVWEVTKITGGRLDVLIANAASMVPSSAWDPIGVLGEQHQDLEADLMESFKSNVVGNIHLFNLYLPLILKGRVKKVIAVSSGMADPEVTLQYSLDGNAPYAISKAALNMAVVKFSTQYSKDGVLFLSICPGVVNTGQYNDLTPHQMQAAGEMQTKFTAYAPKFAGPVPPETAVKDVLSVVDKASLDDGYGGAFVSHLGKGQPWL